MRILVAIVIASILGVVGGAAVAYVEVKSDPDALDKYSGLIDPGAVTDADKKAPHIQVDEPHFNFGSMQRGTTKSHEFIIRNTGNSPLKVRSGGTTCKCTLSEVAEESIPPGGSTTVKLEWTAKSDSGPFRQTATILTNEPSQLELSVDGQILPISGIEPPEFNFDKLSVDEIKSVQVYVMAMLQDDLTVKDPVFADPSVRDKFDVKIEPVDRAALPNKQAKRGVRITVTTKPGLPVGRFNSWLSLRTNLPEAEKVDIPLVGQLAGDISVGGSAGWNEEQDSLLIGSVKSSEGGRGRVNLIVRGPEATHVTFKVLTKPAELNVKIGQPRRLKDTLVHVPVEIEIPPNTRPMVHLDTSQGEAARIVFSTTHSKIKELALNVRFAVDK